MSVRILEGTIEGRTAAILVDSASGFALSCHTFDDGEQAQAFIDWLPNDARRYTERALAQQWETWHDQRRVEEQARDTMPTIKPDSLQENEHGNP